MLGNIELCQYKSPTPIQAYVLPSVLKGIDIIGVAQTGNYFGYLVKKGLSDELQDLGRRLRI